MSRPPLPPPHRTSTILTASRLGLSPSPQRGTARPLARGFPRESSAGCSAFQGAPALLGSLRPSRTVSWSLGWPAVAPQSHAANFCMGSFGRGWGTVTCLSGGTLGPWVAPALRAWTGPHWTPGSSGRDARLGFDRDPAGRRAAYPRLSPRPRSTRSTWGSRGPGAWKAPKTLPSGPVSEPEPFWEGHFLGWVPRAAQGFGDRPCV